MPARRVLVLTALGFEAAPLVHWLRGHWWPVAVAVTGAGPTRARRGAERWIQRYRPTVVLGIGLCGGLAAAAGFGELAVPAAVSDEQGRQLPLVAVGSWIPADRLLSVARPVCRPAVKLALGAQHQARWVDQESYSWAEACAAAGVPLAVLRVVLDPAHAWLPTRAEPRSWPGLATLPMRALIARRILFRAGRQAVCALLSPEAPGSSGSMWPAG